MRDIAHPRPGARQILLKILFCGVFPPKFHVYVVEMKEPQIPLVLGHEIVGKVIKIGDGVGGFAIGERVGVPWLGSTCGECVYCLSGRENLCERAKFTGYMLDGGYAEYTVADHRYCFPVPEGY